MLAPGDRIDRFTIIAFLGEGGMGAVYHARDERLLRDVALKILRADEKDENDPGGAARIAREAKAVAALEHPNVVSFYDVGEVVLPGSSTRTAYLAMELVRGKSLRAFIGDASASVAQRMVWLRQLASALVAVHAIGLVHRDVKPENVIIDAKGRAKVLDFGIAKRSQGSVVGLSTTSAQILSTVTSNASTAGTPLYMAPEQMLGEMVDGRADQFSWGVVAYELLGGKSTWGEDLDAVKLVAAILSKTPTPLDEAALGLPAGVAAVVERTLAKSPAARFATMNDLLTALDAKASEPAPKWRKPATVVAVSAVLAIATIVALRTSVLSRRTTSAQTSTSPQPSSSATPEPAMGFLDVPMSATDSDEAKAKFREGMRRIAEGRFTEGHAALDAARVADPKLASAALQRAYVGYSYKRPLGAPDRDAFRTAMAERAELSPRDVSLLDALAPSFLDPPNWIEGAERFAALSKIRPRDAQVWDGYGIVVTKLGRYPEAVVALEREAEVRPTEVAGYELLSQVLVKVHDDDGAMRVLRECIARSPTSTDCRYDIAWRFDHDGDCAGVDRVAREMTSLTPDDAWGWVWRARASVAVGAPEEAVEELLAASRSRREPGLRARILCEDRRLAAWRRGDFKGALDVLDACDRDDPTPTSDLLGERARARAEILWEIGDTSASAAVADAFVRRLSALETFELADMDQTGYLLAFAHLGGRISGAQHVQRRDAWIASWRRRLDKTAWEDNALDIWQGAYAVPREATREQGIDAMAALPSFGVLPDDWPSPAPVALLLAAGHVDEAKVHAQSAARYCFSPQEPLRHFFFGRALEAAGDSAGACAAYAKLSARWANAKPRSVTLEATRAHAKKLGCTPTP